MNLIIDAQVIKAYFEESVLEHEPLLTASTIDLIERLGHEDYTFLDDGKQIENEWQQLVEPEWFARWFQELLLRDCIREIPVKTFPALKKQLANLGFPTQGREGRDFWYVRTAKATVGLTAKSSKDKKSALVFIISEDLDFYEPSQKRKVRGQERVDILKSDKASIGRYLLKNERIGITCVANYLEDRKQ